MKVTTPLNPEILKVFETVPDLYLILSPELIILTASNTYLAATLTDRWQIQGKHLFEVFPDNPSLPDCNGVANLSYSLQQVLLHRKPHQMALQRYDVPRPEYLGGDFEEKYWSPVNTPVLDSQGQVSYIIHKVSDLTEQLKNRHLLQDLEERERLSEAQRFRLQEVFWQAPVGIAIFTGPAHVVELANSPVTQLWGRSLQQVLNKPLSEAIPEARSQGLEQALESVRKSGVPFIGKETPVTLKGNGKQEPGYFNFIVQPLRHDSRQITDLIYVATEVTPQVLARKAVEESARQVRMMMESLPQIAWTTNAEGVNTYLNSKWYEYTGGKPGDATRFKMSDYLHPEDIRHAYQQWQYSHQQGQPFEVEYRFRRADGQYRWMLGRGLPLHNEQGQIILWIGTCTDIHDMKLTEQTLQQLTQELAASNEELSAANEEIMASNEELASANSHLIRINTDLDNFIYTASHDLKAPISNIEGLMQVLISISNKKGWHDETFLEVIQMMNGSVARFKETIADLTDIARVDKQMTEAPERVNLAAIVQDIELDLQEPITQSGARIVSHIEDCADILFSRKNLKSIAYNLLSNAIKYRAFERRPEIILRCQEEGKYLVFSVQDNGLGIKQADLSKIFGMFKRLHTHVEGTGVGLYIVKKMVENAGGRIELESELGIGSTFRVYFRKEWPMLK